MTNENALQISSITWDYTISDFWGNRRFLGSTSGKSSISFINLRQYKSSLASASVQEAIEFLLKNGSSSENSQAPNLGLANEIICLKREEYIERRKTKQTDSLSYF